MGQQRAEEMLRRGVATAISVGRAQGLPSGSPRVVSHRGNLVVWLDPAPVVARVATLTARMRQDPFVWLAREIAVASYGKSCGAEIMTPADAVDPGPHWVDGMAVSLWTYVECEAYGAGSTHAGVALARLHRQLAGFSGALPHLAPACEQVEEGIASLERKRLVPPADAAALRTQHGDALAEIAHTAGDSVVLHGDAHTGNLLRVGNRLLWTDFEETCRGPREWDLAALATSRGIDAAAALHGYAATLGVPESTVEDLDPFLRLRELLGAVWLVNMAHEYPARYRAMAETRMARVLNA